VRILVHNKLLFTTDRDYPVVTAGYGNGVELMLQRLSASSAAAGEIMEASTPSVPPISTPPLENTHWKLIRLEDQPVTGVSEEKEPYFILNSETGRVSGSGGYNRLTGSYKLDGDHLSFGQMASTMMACIEGMDTEKKFLKGLNEVAKWNITGQLLELSNAGGNVIASLKAHHKMK
jgi:heat shock protein HslJ